MLLFNRINCKSLEKTKTTAYAGRGGAFKVIKLQINSFKNNSEKVSNINLINITQTGNTQFSDIDDTGISTEHFSELIDVDFSIIGSSQKQGLTFEFYNPHKHEVVVYITLIGNNVSSDLIGQK